MNLSIFLDKNLFDAGTSFFKQLNIRLNSNTTTPLHLKDILKDKFKSQEIFEKVSATYFLGLVDKSVFDDKKLSYEQADKKIHADYEGMMIFAVRIEGIDSPTRTKFSDLTRAFNRASQSLPVVVLFQYGNFITLATSERTKYKQTWREGEKIGKISLLKDIDILSTHAGHNKILDELTLKPGVRDFNGLYQQWREVFDVQLLNRNFYKELSSWYFWALRQVEFPDDTEKNKKIRNSTSVIRLITRLIFVWFLKEKRLVPEILFNKKALDAYLKYDDINNSTYYKAILQNLFFATLNTKMKKDDPESRKFVNRQYGVQAFYRYERFFKDKTKALKLFEAIPFLNGGLFENLDKNIGKDNEVRIDCFSNRPVHEKSLKVPDCLFLGDEVVIDLSKEFGSKKRKKEKVRGIIHILNSYKFTIDENTPIEEEIALDPELLGKVFENLLASYNPETQTTARKQTGSFYTPREIVNYMVDESLKASLSNLVSKKIEQTTEDDIKTGLDILFEYTEKEHAFTDNEVFKIVEAISELKILDPACGSGAFPMGILHKLVFILNKIDGDNKKWRELQKQRAVKETEKAYSVGDKEERHQRLKEIEEAFDFNTSDYGRKLFLIENSIYGVDIQPIAVQIAKLRFFISLIVDQNTAEDKENLGILPLPNLETKFVAANTLIGIDKKGQLELNFQSSEIDKKEKELSKVRERHFLARTPKTKEKYREKDKDLRNEIAVLLEKEGFASDVTKGLAHWNPYNQNTHADFFDMKWMFGVKNGFDVVIGNPPYGVKFSSEEKKLYNALFEHQNYQLDSYLLFLEKGVYSVRDGGSITFIIPNPWLTNLKLRRIRRFVSNEVTILGITHYMRKVFDAVVDTEVIMLKKSNPSNNIVNVKIHQDKETFVSNSVSQQKWQKLNGDPINIFLDAKTEKVLDTIKFQTVKMFEICKVVSGMVPYEKGRGKPPQTKQMVKERVYDSTSKVDDSYRHLLRGKDIEKYLIKWKGNRWIKYGDNLAAPRYSANFDADEKIVIRQTGDSLIATLDVEQFVCLKNMHVIHAINKKYSNKFILALLNSTLMNFYYQSLNPEKGEALAEVKKENVEKLVINKTSETKQKGIVSLVNKVLSTKKSNPTSDTTSLEAEIDARVAHLYNLTEEEYALILKETNCPDPFRVAALNVYRDISKEKIKD